MPDRTPFTMIDNNDNSRPLKLVRFHPRVRARKINNRDSISERMKQKLWVADEEIIKNKKKYVFVDEQEGIILHSPKNKDEVTRRILRARKVVMKGQKLSNRFSGHHQQNDVMTMLFALRYKRYTDDSTRDAQKRGMKLAKYVEEQYKQNQQDLLRKQLVIELLLRTCTTPSFSAEQQQQQKIEEEKQEENDPTDLELLLLKKEQSGKSFSFSEIVGMFHKNTASLVVELQKEQEDEKEDDDDQESFCPPQKKTKKVPNWTSARAA